MLRLAARMRILAIIVSLVAGLFGAAELRAQSNTQLAVRPEGGTRTASVMGFDVARYPGDSVLRAWRYPASPFRWVGFYLAAPCRRDSSWVGKRESLAGLGYGAVAIYVGQQDWANHPVVAPRRAPTDSQATDSTKTRITATPTAPPRPQTGACASKFLSVAQGAIEAADAVAKMRAEGFADRSVVYLDVEQVTTVSPAMLDYFRAWITGVLHDGHYRVGVYAAKSNAQALFDAANAAYKTTGGVDRPEFWVASVAGFAPTLMPTDVGFDFAKVWQGQVGVGQTFNGVSLNVDINISTAPNPSAP
jgi:hypothetical protein